MEIPRKLSSAVDLHFVGLEQLIDPSLTYVGHTGPTSIPLSGFQCAISARLVQYLNPTDYTSNVTLKRYTETLRRE